MNTKAHTPDGDLLDDLTPRARKLLKAMVKARAKCHALHDKRDAIEQELMNAMGTAAEAQSAYYACRTMDEQQAEERKRRAAAKGKA